MEGKVSLILCLVGLSWRYSIVEAQCPNDGQHVQFGSECLKFVSIALTQVAAKARCQSDNGHLVSVDNEAKQTFIRQRIQSRGWQKTWIGAEERTTEYRWVYDPAPSYVSMQGCFRDDESQPAFPDIGIMQGNPSPSACKQACLGKGKGYRYFGLQVDRDSLTHYNVICRCGNNLNFTKLTTGCTKICRPAGVHQEFCGGYKTQHVYRMDEPAYNGWGFDQPNNLRSYQNCIAMKDVHLFNWDDDACHLRYNYFCQYPLQSSQCIGSGKEYIANTCMSMHSGDGVIKSWFDANADCKARQGGLIKVTTKALHEALKTKARIRGFMFWIGGTDSEWTWPTGVPFVYNNFAWDQPDENDSRCVVIDQNGSRKAYGWADEPCNNVQKKYPSVCTINYVPPAPTTPTTTITTITRQTRPTAPPNPPPTPPPTPVFRTFPTTTSTTSVMPTHVGGCPMNPNHELFGKECLLFINEKLTQTAAKLRCKAAGGELVSVDSQEKQFYLQRRLQHLNWEEIWIGAEETSTEFQWVYDPAPGFVSLQGCFRNIDQTEFPYQFTMRDPSPSACRFGCSNMDVHYKYFGLEVDRSTIFHSVICHCGNHLDLNKLTTGCTEKCKLHDPNSTYCGGFNVQHVYRMDVPVFNAWGDDQPNNYQNYQNCIAMKDAGDWTWDDDDCHNRYNYFCQYPLDRWQCHMGKQYDVNTCFSVHTGIGVIKSWFKANEDCIQRGGGLIKVTTPELHMALRAIARAKGFRFWIGATDSKWTWPYGARLVYSNFAFVEPDNQGERCAIMNRDSQRAPYQWHDEPCNNVYHKYRAVCSINYVPPTTTPRTTITTTTSTTTSTTPWWHSHTTTTTAGHVTTQAASKEEDGKVPIGVVVAIVVACLVVLLVTVKLIFYCWHRKNKDAKKPIIGD